MTELSGRAHARLRKALENLPTCNEMKQLDLSPNELKAVKHLAEWSSEDHTEGRVLLNLVSLLEAGHDVRVTVKGK